VSEGPEHGDRATAAVGVAMLSTTFRFIKGSAIRGSHCGAQNIPRRAFTGLRNETPSLGDFRHCRSPFARPEKPPRLYQSHPKTHGHFWIMETGVANRSGSPSSQDWRANRCPGLVLADTLHPHQQTRSVR